MAFELSYRDASMEVMEQSRCLPPHMRGLVVDKVLGLVNLTPFNWRVPVVQRAVELPAAVPAADPTLEAERDAILALPFNAEAALWDLWWRNEDLEMDF